MKDIVALSKRERDRLVVLRQVQEGKLTRRAAAEQLGLSRRWLKELVGRLRAEGDQGLAHRLRGRPSNRAHEAALRRRALDLIRKNYADYGPTLAAEVLAQEHSIRVNCETLRQWMSQERLWKPRRAKLKRSTFGGRDAVAAARWCSGIPASTIGWKVAARSCIWWR